MSAGRIVIVGAGLSGLRTAEKLRKLGHQGQLTLIGAEAHPPYDRPPLSKRLLAEAVTQASVTSLRAKDFYDELGLDLRTGIQAVALDARARRLTLSGGDILDFDQLVIATGARARMLAGWEAYDGVHLFRTWEDCLELRAAMDNAGHITIVGAGVLGCEIAASARARGLEVTLLERLEQPLAPVLGTRIGARIAALHRDHGVRVHCSTGVSHLQGNGRVDSVALTDGSTVATDLVVVVIGAVPNTEWLEGSDVTLDNGVRCDRTGRTSVEGIFAVGDVARMPHPHGEGTVRLEHWTSAADTAALVARNLMATPGERTELTEVPYFWSDQYDSKIQCLGLPSPDDELTIADGCLGSGRFLGLFAREGLLTGGVAIGMPAPLARCRRAIAARSPLTEMLDKAPWQRSAARG